MSALAYHNTSIHPKFAACLRNDGSEDLEPRKIYRILPDEAAASEGYLRVIDEAGEDYLYPEGYFVLLELPEAVERALLYYPPRLLVKLPSSDQARIDREKIIEYLLSLSHDDGYSKAVFFMRFGFRIENWQVFREALQSTAQATRLLESWNLHMARATV